MKFVDETKIAARAGNGGDGAVCWRREKSVPLGGPAGGDGGDGGDVIFMADENVHSLLDFHYLPEIAGEHGEKGRSKNQYGAQGASVIAKVPVGTQVWDQDSNELLADFTYHGEQAVICKGGSGGFGNTRFATPTRQAPDFAKPGLEGEVRNLRLELKLMADVGLLGFPNAGKSTLLSKMSAAKPKIADYPFTTLVPQLGVVFVEEGKNFVMADIPGLIKGASEGQGLGFRFLKHLERVRVLCHLIEPLPSYFAADDDETHTGTLIARYEAIREELNKFSEELSELPEIVVVTKQDILQGEEDDADLRAFERYLKKKKIKVVMISAATGAGIDNLKWKLWEVVSSVA
jgi:GTP-binding protein